MSAPHSKAKDRKRNCLPCRETLLSQPQLAGLDVTCTTEPPLVVGPYTANGITCPHGVTFWLEPTGEQIAKWHREGFTYRKETDRG